MTDQPTPPSGEFLLYETADGKTRVECRFVEETLWLTQALMAALFQIKVPTVNEHLKSLYVDGEIRPEATIRKFLIVRQEGGRRVTRSIDYYNLDAILAVGYRVRSTRGTQFRRWATERLERATGCVPRVQRAKRAGWSGDRILKASSRARRDPVRAVRRPAARTARSGRRRRSGASAGGCGQSAAKAEARPFVMPRKNFLKSTQ